MKTRGYILFLFATICFIACVHKNDAGIAETQDVETQNVASLPTDSTLSAIDSLMWLQPDSALACLLPYFDTCCGDALHASLDTTLGDSMETHAMRLYNRHYAQILLAELLYKNYYAQTNRAALIEAVDYFDSLFCSGAARHVSPAPAIAFLDARAHYINGVGYYEQDSIVQACTEYLKALEVMEDRFNVETAHTPSKPIAHIPRFMALTYTRLGDLFSEQFIMESSITCFEKALAFSLIEPTSTYGITSLRYHIGKQYDKMDEHTKAKAYFNQAIEELPNTNNVLYRDIVSSIALCDYQMGIGSEIPLNALQQVVHQTDDENERITRYLTIGAIYFEEKMYDSALVYLESVYENDSRNSRKIQATKYLRIIYDSLGDNKKSYEYMRILSQQIQSEAENKALAIQLNSLFQNYTKSKQGNALITARQKRNKALTITSVFLIIAAFSTWLLFKWKIKQRDKTIQKMETEQQVRQISQAALLGRLKRSNQDVRELKSQIRQQKGDTNFSNNHAATFTDEPIYHLIMERVNDGQFKSQMDCSVYKSYALSKEHVIALRDAVDHHFGQLTTRLMKAYPELTKGDLDYCCFYLINLTDADIAALLQKAYSTVSQRSRKLKAIFKSNAPLSITLHSIANSNS